MARINLRGLDRRQRIAAAVLAVIAAAFVTLDLSGGSLRDAHSGAQGALGSLYRGTDAVIGPARRFVQGVPDVSSNRSKIDALQKENVRLRQQVAQHSEDAASTARLNTLQLTANSGHFAIVPTRVIAFGPGDGFEWTVTIDAGTNSGVSVGQTVTDGVGLVGRVLHANAATAIVLLAADPGSGIGVRDDRTGELGVVTGRGTSGFGLSPLQPTANLRVGDQVLTAPSGQSTYAPGLVVGTISSVRTSSDGTTSAIVKPATSPTALDLIGVIISPGSATAARAALTPATR
jgi:rod shape-determining protein MreC